MVLDFKPKRHPDRLLLFLHEVGNQSGRPRDEDEASHAFRRQAGIGQCRAAGAGAVDRQSPPRHFRVCLAIRS